MNPSSTKTFFASYIPSANASSVVQTYLHSKFSLETTSLPHMTLLMAFCHFNYRSVPIPPQQLLPCADASAGHTPCLLYWAAGWDMTPNST